MQPEETDRALWDQVRNGSDDAFGELFDRYAGRIFAYCFQRTADRAVAEDLTSIVFLEAWRRRRDATFTDDLVRAWLFAIATNVLRNQHRSQRRYRSAMARLPRGAVQPDFAEESDSRLTAEQAMREIMDVVDTIPKIERDCLALCTWQGLSSREAAVALGVAPETVRSRLHRAHKRLRDALGSTDTALGPVVARERKAT
jgi:RNA polymerase sigma factor (sigma-70 family)